MQIALAELKFNPHGGFPEDPGVIKAELAELRDVATEYRAAGNIVEKTLDDISLRITLLERELVHRAQRKFMTCRSQQS